MLVGRGFTAPACAIENDTTLPASGSEAQAAQSEAPLPQTARQALDTCSPERISAALAALGSDAVHARNQLEIAQTKIGIVTQSLAKVRELVETHALEAALAALQPAFEALPEITGYEGCREHVEAFDKLVVSVRAPLVRDRQFELAVKSCDIAVIRSLTAPVPAANEPNGLGKRKNSQIEPVLAVVGALDAAEAMMSSGNAAASLAAITEVDAAISRSPVADCSDLKTATDQMRQAVKVLQDVETALAPAAAACDLVVMRRVWKETSVRSDPWAPNLLHRTSAALSSCAARDAAWSGALDKDP